MAEFDYQRDLAISKNHLDKELIAQAQKMMRYSSEHAQAQYDRDRAKQSLDVVKANLDASIRADLTASQVKFTEAVVDGKIRQSPSYLEAQDRYLKTEHQVNLLLGAVMAMNARRGMLESLVKLFLSGYWSEPRVPGGEEMKAGAALNATETAIMNPPPDISEALSKVAFAPSKPTPRTPPPKV
jgi:hypothetical protein